ncbi:SDR family NAD(P)-dependent oxidoreductase [Georgenia ruanii]|uniref:SDR family oxidoreductase n=1 Tax=Georgenia ruanii TaxID=348442 RepID=A0A7J9UU50_9MICO|nr:SDR family NAD(P)-dependent oxidoreductase [Georgenia ruanii]MPV88032.1 SDR family oxidoreductase [Georgenia ruanii]
MSVLVVTGGASGLGRAIAAQAAAEGWTVVLVDRDADALAVAAEELGVASTAVDVTDREALGAAFASIAERLGRIGGLVNSAGLTRPGPSEGLAVDDWKLVIDVDLSGTFYSCQAAFDHLAESASIVNIASIGSTRGLPERVAYSAAKAGVVGLTRALAAEWAPLGIRVNAVGPSWVDTPLVRDLIASGTIDEQQMLDKVPLGRLCTPEDVASSVLFLLGSDKAGYVTGQTLYVDGGYVWAG